MESARERRRAEGAASPRASRIRGRGAPLTEDEALRRLALARVGRLATVGADGRPRVVPVCFAVDGDRVYSAVDEKPKRTRRLQRLADVEATGRAALLVDHYEEDWRRLWWVRAEGAARVVEHGAELERALALLQDKYEQYRALPPFGPGLVLEIERVVAWSSA